MWGCARVSDGQPPGAPPVRSSAFGIGEFCCPISGQFGDSFPVGPVDQRTLHSHNGRASIEFLLQLGVPACCFLGQQVTRSKPCCNWRGLAAIVPCPAVSLPRLGICPADICWPFCANWLRAASCIRAAEPRADTSWLDARAKSPYFPSSRLSTAPLRISGCVPTSGASAKQWPGETRAKTIRDSQQASWRSPRGSPEVIGTRGNSPPCRLRAETPPIPNRARDRLFLVKENPTPRSLLRDSPGRCASFSRRFPWPIFSAPHPADQLRSPLAFSRSAVRPATCPPAIG